MVGKILTSMAFLPVLTLLNYGNMLIFRNCISQSFLRPQKKIMTVGFIPHYLMIKQIVPVIEYLLEEKSEVSHKRIQIDHGNSYYFQFDRILQNEESSFKSTSFSFSGLFSRYDIHSDLRGINSDCSFHGLYVTDKNQHQENEISTTHSVEKCSSDQMFKGILAGKSRAIFSGKVLVKKDAQKTRAFQKDLNFLLSQAAEIDTKPSLEIYADDVECSHGATAGNIDKNMLILIFIKYINILQISLDQNKKTIVSVTGRGCAISQASGSLMAEKINLLPYNELQSNVDLFRKLIRNEILSEEELDSLGDVSALSGVRKFPVRIKCAMLSWVALEEIIKKNN